MFRHTGAKLLLLLVVVALTGGGAALVLSGHGGQPARTPPVSAGSPTPDPSRPPLLASLPSSGTVPTAAGLQRVLAAGFRDPRLGAPPAFSIVDVESGQVLLSGRPGVGVVPASTAKIATAVAVLSATDPGQRLATTVLAGPAPGDVVLVGGGDPTLAGPRAPAAAFGPARLADLARQVRAGLGATVVKRVLVDDSLFTGPLTGPEWKPDYVGSGDVARVMALSVDGGRVQPGQAPRVADPALAAGRALASMLRTSAAVAVSVGRGRAAPGAAQLGVVLSPRIPVLVEQMLERSDNDLAEALSRQVALARGLPPSFAGGAQAVAAVLAELAVPGVSGGVDLQDGSGLSRNDRVRPAAVAALLVRAASSERLRPLLTGLPVAGFDGTLAERFRSPATLPAAGIVRAKTGTLEGVSALAGLVRTRDGRLLAFDLTADGVALGATWGAEAALDALAAALASCGCS